MIPIRITSSNIHTRREVVHVINVVPHVLLRSVDITPFI